MAVAAQRIMVPSVGFLTSGSPNERRNLVDAFLAGLKDGGYVDGKDVVIEYRWAEGRYDRLPRLASELVERKVGVMVTSGAMAATLAAKSATSTIPIVFTGGWDPVKLGVVASLSRPGGNVTGVANLGRSLDGKRVELLRDLVPAATRMAYLVNPKAPDAQSLIKQVQMAGAATGTKIQVLEASSDAELDVAFTAVKQSRALVVSNESIFITRRDRVVALAAQHALPACYPFREFVLAGGLMSYGPDRRESYRQAGVYAARILKGAKPADLPVVQATKIEITFNPATAKKLGLVISRDFFARVDEVIQ
jgi:putative ABC transport system substrate-binding protein